MKNVINAQMKLPLFIIRLKTSFNIFIRKKWVNQSIEIVSFSFAIWFFQFFFTKSLSFRLFLSSIAAYFIFEELTHKIKYIVKR